MGMRGSCSSTAKDVSNVRETRKIIISYVVVEMNLKK